MRVAHSNGLSPSHPYLSCSSPRGGWLIAGQGTIFRRCQGFGKPVIPSPAISHDRYPRCSEPPGVNSATFSARSSDIRGRPLADKGLCPVLRTQAGRPPPRICLPSTSRCGHTCASTHAFASGLLQACIAAAPLPLATVAARCAHSRLRARVSVALQPASVPGDAIFDRLGLDFARQSCQTT